MVTDYVTKTTSHRPVILPFIRVVVAFAAVFSIATAVYLLIGLSLEVVSALLGLGIAAILILAILTPWRISTRYKAAHLCSGQSPRLENIIEDLSDTYRVPEPRILLIPDSLPNAMAFGFGKQTYLGVTQGLLDALDEAELRAVIAHEFSHIWSRDSMTQSLGVAVKSTLVFVSAALSALFIVAGLLIVAVVSSLFRVRSRRIERSAVTLTAVIALGFLILAPLTICIGYFFFSRRTEFRADAHSAKVTGRPMDLASALLEIDKVAKSQSWNTTNGVYSSLWIIEGSGDDLIGRLLSSHPAIEERIRRLTEMHDRLKGSHSK